MKYLSVLFAVLPTLAMAELELAARKTVGAWNVVTLVDAASGRVQVCTASVSNSDYQTFNVSFRGGSSLPSFSVNDYDWRFGLEPYVRPITIGLDDSKLSLAAELIGMELYVLFAEEGEAISFFDQLTQVETLTFYGADGNVAAALSLAHGAEAIGLAQDCWEENLSPSVTNPF